MTPRYEKYLYNMWQMLFIFYRLQFAITVCNDILIFTCEDISDDVFFV